MTKITDHDSRLRFCPRCASPLVLRASGGRERQSCSVPSCDYVFWGNPVPVVAAILEHEGNVILVRNINWPPKWYGLVTGYLESGEAPEAAVLREIKEEVGLEGQVISLVGIYSFTQKNEIIIAYHVKGSGVINIGEELADYKRVPPEKLRAWEFGTGLAVRDWLKTRALEG